MNRIIVALILVSYSCTVFSDRSATIESIRRTYENQTAITEEYLSLKYEKMELGKFDPCLVYADDIVELQRKGGLSAINMISNVVFGDFNETEGYNLILDDFSIIHTPAIVKCIPKLKDGNPLRFGSREFIYYFVMFKHEEKTSFENVWMMQKPKNNRSTVILEEALIIQDYLITYTNTNSQQRKAILNWFKMAGTKNNPLLLCEAFSTMGKMKENSADKWEIVSANIDTSGPFVLLVTNNIEVKLYGIVECNINVVKDSDDDQVQSSNKETPSGKKNTRNKKTSGNKKNTSSKEKSSNEENPKIRYYTLAKIGMLKEPDRFNYLYGPVKVNKTKVFALSQSFLKKYSNNITDEVDIKLEYLEI